SVGDGEHSLRIQFPGDLDQIVDERRSGEVYDQIRRAACRRQLQVGGETQGGIPSVRNEAYAALLRHPCDPALFADAAYLGNVGLHDIEGPLLEPGRERLSSRQDLSAG